MFGPLRNSLFTLTARFPTAMTTNRETVTRIEFRLRQHEADYAERLADGARAAGRCVSDHARELIKTALTSNEELMHSLYNIQQELAQIQGQLKEMIAAAHAVQDMQEDILVIRDDLATYATKLLTDAGRLDATTAKKWVQQSFRAD